MKQPNGYWRSYRDSLTRALDKLEVTNAGGVAVDAERSIEMLSEWTGRLRTDDGTLHLVGNGASASMASHMAADWTKNAGVRALAYNDAAFLTAIGNDLGYEHVFAGPLSWYGRTGDLLATISSSGNSPNVLGAIHAARDKGCRIVTFSGMRPDNKSRRLGDLNLFVPAHTYGVVESSHALLLHVWFDRFMNVREWDATDRQTPPPLGSRGK